MANETKEHSVAGQIACAIGGLIALWGMNHTWTGKPIPQSDAQETQNVRYTAAAIGRGIHLP